MSLTNEWWEWHLTPHGWKRGSVQLDSGEQEAPTPPDRVLTVRWVEYQSSSFSKAHLGWEEQWRSLDEAKFNSIVAKLGERPLNKK